MPKKNQHLIYSGAAPEKVAEDFSSTTDSFHT